MRVVQVGGTYVGAQKKIETDIHNALIEKGNESYILYLIGNSDDRNIIKYENKFENIIRRGLIKIFGKCQFFSILTTLHLIYLLKKLKPDIIHLHVIHHGYVDYISLFKYLSKLDIPIVFTMHDLWAFTGGCYYNTSINCNKFEYDCNKCLENSKLLDCNIHSTKINLEKKLTLYKNIKNISFVSVSKWLYNQAKESKIKNYKNYIIYNSIDFKKYKKININKSKNKKFKIIGVANAWTDRKGIDKFISLAKLLGDNYEINLVGVCNENTASKFPNNINILGRIDNQLELFKLYANSNIHISMSKEETFGMTFIEAACAGIKSIGFNSTAIPEVINLVNGYVVENDLNEIIDIIKYLNKNRKECKLSLEEINEIKNKFSIENMTNRYIEIYNKELNKR